MRFSIVLPTQDRATLLAVAAKHAMQLDHPDFELIVSSNATTAETQRMNMDAVREFIDAPNFKIVQPPRPLSPPEHFEFALQHAQGDYVAYLTDKMVVFPHALSDAEAVISASGADIVNWACAGYYLDDPGSPLGPGNLVEEFEYLNGRPQEYDPIATLRFKASGEVPRTRQGTKDFIVGKLVFGCYSRSLIDRILSTSGTLFGGATHDYSAMIQALSLARTCVTLNAYEALFFSLPREQSLGSATATEPQRALQYYKTFTDPDSLLSSLLVPYVYASPHNMVAHDYKKFLPLYGNAHLLGERNWIRDIYADLLSDSMIWLDPEEKQAQISLFQNHVPSSRIREMKLRRRAAEWRASALRARDRKLNKAPATPKYQELSAASLEQAMEHALSRSRVQR